MCEKWYDYMQPGWCEPVIEEFMENECEALPGVAYPGVWDNRSTLNTKTGYDDDDDRLVTWNQMYIYMQEVYWNVMNCTSVMWIQ